MNSCRWEEENISGFNHDAPASLTKASGLRIKWGDDIIKAWAFRSCCGHTLLVTSSPSDSSSSTDSFTIDVRSDNPRIIQLLSSEYDVRDEFTSVFIPNRSK
jgi:hypothetical protein